MAAVAAHESNYPGRYTVPSKNDPQGGYLPRGPPLPIPENPNVLRFTAFGKSVRNCEVLDHTNTPLYRFQSSGSERLEMYDAANNLIGKYSDKLVVYRGGGPVKGKKFVKHGAAGKTGAVVLYEGVEFEIVQELFYSIVRNVHTTERVAIIYNYTGKLAVEMTETGIGNAGLHLYLVFVAGLTEAKVVKGGLVRSLRKLVPKRNT